MKLRSHVIAACFFMLALHYATTSPSPGPAGYERGVWRGVVSTVSARGAMLSGLWVSSPELAACVDRGDSLLVLGDRRGMYITPWSLRVKPATGVFPSARRALVNRFARCIPDSLALGISTALMLGSRGRVPLYAARAFQLSGTAHLLALSGMHTGIVAGFILGLARLLFGRRPAGSVAAVLSIALFVALTGGRASTVRAGMMAGMAILWKAFRGGSVHPLSVWCIALFPAALDPAVLSDTGAQMSYGAVLSLILLGRSWNGVAGKVLTPLWAGIVVIATLAPLSSTVYGSINPAGAASTVLSVPVMTAVMGLGALAATGTGSGLLSWLCRLWLGMLGLFTGCTVEVAQLVWFRPTWFGTVFLIFAVRVSKNCRKRFR